jgi:hypothetical protein
MFLVQTGNTNLIDPFITKPHTPVKAENVEADYILVSHAMETTSGMRWGSQADRCNRHFKL